MKIRTLLLTSAVAALLATLGGGIIVWLAVAAAADASAEEEHAQEASRETANLLVLTQEYVLHFEPRAAQQWQQRQAALALILAGGHESPALQSLRRTNGDLPQVFDRLLELPGSPDSPLKTRRQEFLVDELLTATQILADGAYRWAREASATQMEAERRSQHYGMAAFALVVALLLAQALLVMRRVLGPVARLGRATAAVERGDLNMRLKGHTEDELGELNRSFNAMTESLAQRTAQLDREIALRAESEARVRSIITNAPDAFISIDEEGRIDEWNRQAELTFGWQRDEVLGQLLSDLLIPPGMRAGHNAGMKHFVRTGVGPVINNRLEVNALHRDGHEIPVQLSIAAMKNGDTYTANAFLHDISGRRAAQERLSASEKRLRDITNNVPVIISYIDADHRLQFVNETFHEWMGVAPGDAVGRKLIEVVGPVLHSQRRHNIDRALKGERVVFEVESEMRGQLRCLQNVYIPDVRPDGTVAGLYAVASDVTALKQVERRLNELARIDTLTSLPNRRQLEEKLDQAVKRSRRSGRPLAVLFLDIDHFKQINDKHGHGVGDEVLKEFAVRLVHCVRSTDTVARLAGDEFVIVLEGLNDSAEAQIVARKIGQALGPAFGEAAGGLALSSSIGVAFVDAGTKVTPEQIIAKADEALYRAKRAGRATFAVTEWSSDDLAP
ncbi:diguanylate cyclase domain-containing protein [Piscinibacter terrae]|uniref:Diguanylate cyclase n=1 Tax=Piscinibacter terrae TaxID=2496871 RepID=A0A3N7HXF7_9BURK|nr:diguanylate cyclase [Albitalea terrae]RQP26593.1 diguanylate cyclase [Albitalea terrae]